ncbi:hypothetical protein TNCV_4511801 [Trichonephila clavipes]|nr:hypothetical protein TNCV_4511801 [Trichonephila clavipes]
MERRNDGGTCYVRKFGLDLSDMSYRPMDGEEGLDAMKMESAYLYRPDIGLSYSQLLGYPSSSRTWIVFYQMYDDLLNARCPCRLLYIHCSSS